MNDDTQRLNDLIAALEAQRNQALAQLAQAMASNAEANRQLQAVSAELVRAKRTGVAGEVADPDPKAPPSNGAYVHPDYRPDNAGFAASLKSREE